MAPPFPTPTEKWHSTTYPSISPTRPELSAKGKTVVVTGGGTGIGAETARYFARAGASQIAILGRREKPLLDTKALIEKESPETKVFAASTDVTNKSEVEKAFSNFVGDGKIHVLVSNAALIGPQDIIEKVDGEEYVGAISRNLKGTLNVAQAFLPRAAPNAVIIDVNSSAAHVNFAPIFSAYSISKWSVFRFWDFVQYAHPETSVFHVQPGVIDTAMSQETGGVEAMGFSDDVSLPASFNVWLTSPEASFLKGKFLWANWDVDELKDHAKEIESSGRFTIGLGGWPFASDNWKFNWKGYSTSSS